MAQDIATLGIRVDASGATRELRAFGDAATRTTAQTAALSRTQAAASASVQRASTAVTALTGAHTRAAGAAGRHAAAAQNAASQTRALGTASARAASQTDLLAAAGRRVVAAFGVYQALRWAQQTIAAADAFTNLRSRLALVTTSTENLTAVQSRLFDLSQRTRTSFEATADLYTRLARSASGLGASQADLLRVTETISKAMVVSGASAAASQAALVQLGQAFASGALRGEELNSVLEQAPRLADAIAAGMGVTVGQLRKLSAEGKLTAKDVFDAIKSQGAAMDAEFAKMPATVGGAMTQVKNAALLAIGQLDKATGSSKALAGALQTVANNAPAVAAGLGAITAAILAAASAWAVYRGAALLAAGATALLAGASSIATLVSLAGAVKSVGDAFAFASLAFPYLRIAVAIVAALTAGYAIYKRIKGEATGKPAEVSTAAPAVTVPAITLPRIPGTNGEDAARLRREEQERRRELVTGLQERVQLARQEYELAGMSGIAAERLRIEHEATNAEIRARRTLTGDDLDATLRAVANEKMWKLAAADVNDIYDRRQDRLAEIARVQAQHARVLADGIEGAITDAVNRRNPLLPLVEQFKRSMIRAVAESLTTSAMASVGPKIAKVLGIDLPATKQTKAAKDMKDAAEKQEKAAKVMLEAAGMDPNAGQARQSKWGALLDKAKGPIMAGIGGYTVGYGVGSSTGSGVLGALGGGLAGAKMGAAFGPAGIAVGALAGVAGGLLGAADAAREAKARLEAARRAFRDMSATLDAEFRGDPLAGERVRITQQYEELRQAYLDQISVAEALGGALRDVNGAFADIAKREAARLALAEAAYKAQVADTIGGYRERELRAMGKETEAGELGRQNERARLIASFGAETDDNEKLILAALDAAQAAERNTKATEANTAALTRVLNAPSGYKVEADIYRFATPAARPRPGFSPSSPFTPPQTPLTGTPQLSRGSTAVNVTFNIDGTKTTRDQVKQIATELKKVVTETLGSNADIAEGWGLLA
jgi:tape measure domain-containing protein